MSAQRFALAFAALLAVGAGASSCTVDAYCYSCADGGVTNESTTGTGGAGQGGQGGGVAAECATDAQCQGGRKCCAGSCVDLDSDVAHCGVCGNACDSGTNSTPECTKGQCSITCSKGFADCDLLAFNGCEINILGNPLHCGDCKTACLFANAAPSCEQGKCGIASCTMGFADCDKKVENGCEVNLGTDSANCSACGNACKPPANSVAICQAGKCSAGACAKGFGDCNNDKKDGCEVDLQKDSANCGVCGVKCPMVPNGAGACVAGFCGVGACEVGYADCDASSFDGCESKLDSDVANCGACGAACPMPANGTPKCENSTCLVATCNAGYDDCNKVASDGCEIYLPSSVQNCGACGNLCDTYPHSTPSCAGSQCGIASCDQGYAHCFGDVTNGCETNLTNDLNHCGKCETICPAIAQGTGTCAKGLCAILSCNANYADCDGNIANGCETLTLSDAKNCGSCNTQCSNPPNGSAECNNGQCGLGTCDAGYADCDNNPQNGCEKDVLADPLNCGGCGIVCGSGQCANGACTCTKKVLVLADDGATGAGALATAIGKAGYAVDVSTTMIPAGGTSYQYTGSNPPLAAYGSVVVLAGGPGTNSYQTEMPQAGQQALHDFVTVNGNGIVFTEWAALQVYSGQWQTLKDLVLLQRTAAFSGQETYTVDPAYAKHPIWANLSASFTFAASENVGLTMVAPYVSRIAGGTFSPDTVAIRDAPVGRVVHISYAGNYQGGWGNANLQTLVANAAGWAARCN
jgi:hypothetical protein